MYNLGLITVRFLLVSFSRFESVQRKTELSIRVYFLIQGDPGDS